MIVFEKCEAEGGFAVVAEFAGRVRPPEEAEVIPRDFTEKGTA
ncbi:hypothetical protein [Lentzea jiangxiensis]|nr:hypothetical protein [Lentzea jiangxiensis]